MIFKVIHKQLIDAIQSGCEEAAYMATRLMCLHLRRVHEYRNIVQNERDRC